MQAERGTDKKLWYQLTESAAPKEAPGLYVHVPFCKTKCPYCDFYSEARSPLRDSWLDALRGEASFRWTTIFGAFDSLYIGGGTPSVLGLSGLETLFGNLRRGGVELSPGAELTVELNADDVTAELVGCLRRLGVNRVSVGVQSFDDSVLQFLGRRHDGKKAVHALETLRASGFRNISVDVMYGWKGHTIDALAQDIGQALAFEPAHLSCYQLTIESSTAFGRSEELRDAVAGSERQRELFLAAHEMLGEAGFEHYEVSNFAKPTYRSRHNQKYWKHVSYLGLGPAAHSFRVLSSYRAARWWNVQPVAAYIDTIEDPKQNEELIGVDELRLERLFLGFRTAEGFPRSLAEEHGNGQRVLEELESQGLVEVTATRVMPTVDGLLVADRLPLLFEDPVKTG